MYVLVLSPESVPQWSLGTYHPWIQADDYICFEFKDEETVV